jgi:signal transduction protein with GAF and PtsI domain
MAFVAVDPKAALEAKQAEYKMLVTEHQKLRHANQVLERLLHLYGAPANFDAVFEGLMDAAMAAVDAESGALYVLDADKNELYFAAARGPKAREVLELDIKIKPGQGMAGACFQNSEVIAVSDVHKDPRFFKEVSGAVGYEVRSLLTAPIVCEGEVFGVIQVINKRGSDEFDMQEVESFKRLGRYGGSLIGLGLELQQLRQVADAAATR